MKRRCSLLSLSLTLSLVPSSLSISVRPSPLAGCLVACCLAGGGERDQSSKQTGGGQAATAAGVFCPPAQLGRAKQNQGPFLLLFFFNRPYFLTPLFSLSLGRRSDFF